MGFAEITGKDHISPSQIDMMLKCGQQYKFRYLEGIKSAPGFALIVGSGTHDGVEYDLTKKLNTGELATIEEISDAAADSVRERFKKEDVQCKDGESAGVAVDQAVQLCGVHHSDLAPTLNPEALELELRIEVDGYPVGFLGYADIVEKGGVVRDIKTSASKKQQKFIDTSLQITYYDWAYETLMEAALAELRFDVLVKTKKPYVQLMETTRDDSHRIKFLHYAESLIESVERGVFHPAVPGDWLCSEKFCGYWSRCKYGARQAVTK